jgi:N-acetylmuramoyl-L-alanine amidase
MSNLYLIAGHDLQRDPGALAYDLTTEASLTAVLRDDIARALAIQNVHRHNGTVMADNDSHSLLQTIQAVNATAKAKDYLLDIHFNYNAPKASGTEVFYAASTNPANIARAGVLSAKVADAMGISNRGAKPDTLTQHGRLGILRDTIPQALLLEVCFLNAKDLTAYRNWRGKVVAAIAAFYRPFLAPNV